MKHYILLLFPLLLLACDNLEECLNDCPPSHYPTDCVCGEDSWVYEGECQLACHGLEAAEDALFCATPLKNEDCTGGNRGKIRYFVTESCELEPGVCSGSGSWATYDMAYSPLSNPCFADCPPCPEDEDEFICGKRGMLYCNACVMACLEDEAGEASGCEATAAPAHFCDPQADGFATHRGPYRYGSGGKGCNTCECAASGLWHCTCWACPGEEMFP